MRLVRLLAPSLALAASALLVSCASRQPPGPVGPRATHRVNLAVSCSGDSVSFTLSPWYLSVNRGDVVEWQITAPPGQVLGFRIDQTPHGRWPWRGRITGGPQLPAIAPPIGAIPSGAYRYQVAFECVDAQANRRHNVVVDPDIWLD